MFVQRNIEERSRNHCCSGKAVNVLSVCVSILPLVVRPANRIFSARHYTVKRGFSAPHYFSALTHKQPDFHEKLLKIKCVL
jgi:hypothetical protein